MASNEALTAQAVELGKNLGKEVETEGKNNAELAELVSGLKAKDKKRAEEKQKTLDKKVARKKANKKPPFYVADGKSITSKKGILVEGDEVKVEYLGGGEKALEALINSEVVIET